MNCCCIFLFVAVLGCHLVCLLDNLFVGFVCIVGNKRLNKRNKKRHKN